jgi:hypothetical protein
LCEAVRGYIRRKDGIEGYAVERGGVSFKEREKIEGEKGGIGMGDEPFVPLVTVVGFHHAR